MSSVDLNLLIPILLIPLLSILTIIFMMAAAKNGRGAKIQPKSYPLIGMEISRYIHRHNRMQWATDILKSTPSLTFTMHRFFPIPPVIDTANPANVNHILNANFHNYQKGPRFRAIFHDLLGDGIFNADGENWKFQRQVASREFSTKSLRRFMATVVEDELRDRLMPVLASAAETDSVLDLQDVLQRFTFDNICQIAFGYDPAYLSVHLTRTQFADAFERATFATSERYYSVNPMWIVKKFLNIGSEKELRADVEHVRNLALTIIKQKKTKLGTNSNIDDAGEDLLSRFLSSGHSDLSFVADIVISFVLAGRDTTSAALTWFFWLVQNNPRVESEILREVSKQNPDLNSFEEARELIYTHAALCESMRLYPPVPVDVKQAVNDDVLPDGTKVRKGMVVAYIPYAMGRMEELWGADWEEFRPERWLQKDEVTNRVKLVGIDWCKYPVFQAGPRICLGKDMAFLQMKRVVAGVMKEFKVAPAVEGFEPAFEAHLTAKMRGGFPVRVEKRKIEDAVNGSSTF